MYDAEILNSADYFVPQTRRRFIFRAVQGLLRPMPAPSRWMGWYEAIEDLIDTLPASEFAPWQLARLPAEPQTFLAAGSGNTNFNDATPGFGMRESDEPSHVISADGGGRIPRAFITRHRIDHYRAFIVGALPHAWLSQGRVVKMTPRALARFQSFPDWYQLPGNISLACKIIGNAVPPLMYKAIAESLT